MSAFVGLLFEMFVIYMDLEFIFNFVPQK